MKVLQINSVCGIRSTGRICTDIATVLEQHNHQCRIAYGRESVPEEYQRMAVRIGSTLSVKLDGLNTRLFDSAGFHSVAATKQLLKWMKEYDPDIIHLHNLHGYYVHIGLLFDFLSSFRKPVIWTLHDCWPLTGHCAYYDYAQCDKWQTGCAHCGQIHSYPCSLFLDHSKQNHKKKLQLFQSVQNLHFIPVSHWMAQQKSASLLKQIPHTTIHNGIDLTQFRPIHSTFRTSRNLKNKRIYLGVASIWDRRKGFDTFLHLSQMLHPDEVIVLVGLNEKQLEQLPPNIIGIQRTNSAAELAEIYTASDVFLNPTLEDNYPTVNLEAQACGLPVVTYDTGGSPESITEKSGRVVPKGDALALLLAARSLHLNRAEIIQDAQRFDKKKTYLEYLKVYEECLH